MGPTGKDSLGRENVCPQDKNIVTLKKLIDVKSEMSKFSFNKKDFSNEDLYSYINLSDKFDQ